MYYFTNLSKFVHVHCVRTTMRLRSLWQTLKILFMFCHQRRGALFHRWVFKHAVGEQYYMSNNIFHTVQLPGAVDLSIPFNME